MSPPCQGVGLGQLGERLTPISRGCEHTAGKGAEQSLDSHGFFNAVC